MYSSAKKLQRVLSAGEIRKTFIDYFTEHHDHKFVRSSPVVPFCDPTVAFVNAGMNQFKSVFLGKTQAPYPRVANSQKCVRVGGKHNDLEIVGQDSYHHTFFEMLGNWSFGDYFKREACEMALDLLRGPYNIDINRLYVTYFAGDQVLGLPPDEECFEIWRSLGFPSYKILPFGCKDNFWEMGNTGPCGPCTEIHYDHRPDLGEGLERAKLVNAGRSDLTELWNLVFIQYNRNPDGSISHLPANHVDTGMGFERLTALLQQKNSNYDTDLFTPIFDAIQKTTKTNLPPYHGQFPTSKNNAALDTAYRILADHSRMIAICLADGMLPDQNQKLRRVLRKAFKISEQIFHNENLVSQLMPIVADILGTAYPELHKRQIPILELIAHELEVYKMVKNNATKAFTEILTEFPNLKNIDLTEYPGLIPAYRDFQLQKRNFINNLIPGKFLYKLSDTYGLTEESFQKLAELENMKCDFEGFKNEVQAAKQKLKNTFLNNATNESLTQLTQRLPATNNSFKYDYSYDMKEKCYNFPIIKAKIQGLLINDEIVEKIEVDNFENSTTAIKTISIITDKSNFYYESGGQQNDLGEIILNSNSNSKLKLKVIDVKNFNDCIVHICKVEETTWLHGKLQLNDEVLLKIDPKHRQGLMCHHTATHLLNGAIRTLFQKVTYQVSSAVYHDHCKLELGLIGMRLNKDDIEKIDDLIGRIICQGIPVKTSIINALDVIQSNDDITMVPGEIYPETDLRLITIDNNADDEPHLKSKELCCGTHLKNTQELEYFCIINCKLINRARYTFTAMAGPNAEKVLKTAALLKKRVDLLEEQCLQPNKLTNATETELQKIRNNILHNSEDLILPYTMRITTLERINELLKNIKETTRTKLSEFVDVEMKNLLQEKPNDKYPFLVHYIRSSALVEEVPLQRATKLCTDRPILVFVMCNGMVRARCCVPKKFITEEFNAEKWLQEFAQFFKAQIIKQKGHDTTKACNMKSKKVGTQFEEQLELAMAKANDFAKQHIQC